MKQRMLYYTMTQFKIPSLKHPRIQCFNLNPDEMFCDDLRGGLRFREYIFAIDPDIRSVTVFLLLTGRNGLISAKLQKNVKFFIPAAIFT